MHLNTKRIHEQLEDTLPAKDAYSSLYKLEMFYRYIKAICFPFRTTHVYSIANIKCLRQQRFKGVLRLQCTTDAARRPSLHSRLVLGQARAARSEHVIG